MKLSIIMPCFNVESTLKRALDSIFMQDIQDDYEVIIIDDASTDNTVSIVEAEIQDHPQIRLIKNAINSGNAKSFYKGLCAATGDYFCVLDGDDYYTVTNKLSKQINFLDSDTKQEYVAVATYFIIDFGNGSIHIPRRTNRNEFNYTDMLNKKGLYFHTATYMYRNIFKDNVPEYFNMTLYRGDTPRTIFHLMYSGKKVHVLDFVGSAYSYTFDGIWTALDEKKHFQYQVDFYSQHRQYLRTDYERAQIDEIIAMNQDALENAKESDRHHYPDGKIQDCLDEIGRYANIFAFHELDFMLKQLYSSEYLDTLLASIGTVARINNPEYEQVSVNPDCICILISKLNPKGGGIFTEISELIEMYEDYEIHVIQTLDSEIADGAIETLTSKGSRVIVESCPKAYADKFDWLAKLIAKTSPYRIYCYCAHNDPYSSAVIKNGVCENICLFSFDHGFVLGLQNPNLDTIDAKRPVDYQLLSTKFDSKLSYLPAWSHGLKPDEETSTNNFSKIITASGAARFYKINGEEPYNYLNIILKLLKETEITHYHFGPIPEEIKNEFINTLKEQNIDEKRFVHIEWSENIAHDMKLYGVNLFIEPFPTVSYKLTLNTLSAGIPIAAWQSINRMSIADFIPDDSIMWKSANELIEKINQLNPQRLEAMSNHALEYFKNTHSFETIRPYVLENKSFPIEAPMYFVDNTINDISDHFNMFNINEINVMGFLDRRNEAIALCTQLQQSRSLILGLAISNLFFRQRLKNNENALTANEIKATSAEEFVDKYGAENAKRKLKELKNSKIFKIGRYLTRPDLLLRSN